MNALMKPGADCSPRRHRTAVMIGLLAILAVSAIGPALAEDGRRDDRDRYEDRDRHDDRGRWEHEQMERERWQREHHYAPPPVVIQQQPGAYYAAPPVVMAPPAGLSIVLPAINIR